ncbi:kinase-like domain-containing protein [Xylariaceae sp. FL1019]|nr:kinase-like domain-containing protein [Xylariaceae sp. FL1019]
MPCDYTGADILYAAVSASKLRHPDLELVQSFVDHALDRARAISFVIQAYLTNTEPRAGLERFLVDWKRLVSLFAFPRSPTQPLQYSKIVQDVTKRDGVCFLTRRNGSFVDPLVVVPIFPDIDRKSLSKTPCLREMLLAFLDQKLLDWLISLPHGSSDETTENFWLLRKSALLAFSRGFNRVTPVGSYYLVHTTEVDPLAKPSFVKRWESVRVSPPNLAHMGIRSPDHSALTILSHFAEPIRWIHISHDLAHQQTCRKQSDGPPPRSQHSPFLRLWPTITGGMLRAWLHVPVDLRVATYRTLARAGKYLYGTSSSLDVQRLPFGLYLKMRPRSGQPGLANECNALDLVRRFTTITIPRPLDFISHSSHAYLITSQLRGIPVGMMIDSMSNDATAALVSDLRKCINQLRAIPNTVAGTSAVTDTRGLAIYDGRVIVKAPYDEVRGDYHGPFETEREFNNLLKSYHLPDVEHEDSHAMVLSHADINMRNVLVDDDGRLSGVVDWEMAGWYPEYWEYTKTHFTVKRKWRWLMMMDELFAEVGDYRKELGIERQLWYYCD